MEEYIQKEVIPLNETGRPCKFETVEQLQKAIDEYFDYCDENNKPYTVSGLAYALDTTRRTLLDYQEKEEFSHTIKKAKAKIEQFNEELLYSKDVPTVGVIFNLKNNYEWKDKQEIDADLTSDVTINIELSDD
jgi:hypothetical protein